MSKSEPKAMISAPIRIERLESQRDRIASEPRAIVGNFNFNPLGESVNRRAVPQAQRYFPTISSGSQECIFKQGR